MYKIKFYMKERKILLHPNENSYTFSCTCKKKCNLLSCRQLSSKQHAFTFSVTYPNCCSCGVQCWDPQLQIKQKKIRAQLPWFLFFFYIFTQISGGGPFGLCPKQTWTHWVHLEPQRPKGFHYFCQLPWLHKIDTSHQAPRNHERQ